MPSVGFDDKRGDILSLLNSPFVDQAEKIPELPLWKQPENVADINHDEGEEAEDNGQDGM